MRKPNIILVTLDDCRPDHLGFGGYKKNTSPFLDSLARKSVYFKKAFSTGAGSPQSFVGTLTSTYPWDYGGFSRVKLPRVLVSEVLQKVGYRTVAVHSAAYLSSYFGYDRGWDTFRYISHFRGGGTMEGIRSDTARAKFLRKVSGIRRWLKEKSTILAAIFNFLEGAILLIRKIVKDLSGFTPPFALAEEVNEEAKKLVPRRPGKPLFLWVHYMDVHEPLGFFWYRGHGLWKKLKFHLADILLFLFGDRPKINQLFKNLYIELYDASIRHVDQYIGKLFDYLSGLGVINHESLVVICSDHGEEFFEHGDFGHAQRPFHTNFHVPLVFYSPKKLKPQTIERPVSLIDVSPTIAEYAGAPKPRTFKGKSVFDAAERDVVSQIIDCEGDLTNLEFIGATLICKGHKLIHFRGKEMLFSMDDMAEKHDLYHKKPEIVKLLKSRLKNYAPNKFLDT